MQKNLTVAIFFGGRSSEHEISVRSALYVLENISKKYKLILVGTDKEGSMFSVEGLISPDQVRKCTQEDLAKLIKQETPDCLKGRKIIPSLIIPVKKSSLGEKILNDYRILNYEIDVIFPVFHGQYGEDGRFQSLCELADIPFIGCSARVSGIAMDKHVQKRLVKYANIDIVDYEYVLIDEWKSNKDVKVREIEKNISYPCFIKPNSLGSSIGTGKAVDRKSLTEALDHVFEHDYGALVERWMEGTEVECCFLGTAIDPKISSPGQIVVTKDYCTYEEKYTNKSTTIFNIPAKIEEEKKEEVTEKSKKIAYVLGLYGFSRIDYWLCKNTNKLYFNEVNSIPGLTTMSLYPQMWKCDKLPAEQWMDELIDLGIKRRNVESGFKTSFISA